MDADALAECYPVLYHVAHVDSWESIKKHGLLSTSALLDLFEVDGAERTRIECCRRPECVAITHPRHGTAVVRDQKPMSEKALLKCLEKLTPRQWYKLLNGMVFFWPTEKRLGTFLNARAYRDDAHCVLVVSTAELVQQHQEKLLLSPINSGSTVMYPRPRGRATFLPIPDYPFQDRKRRCGKANAIAEVATKDGISDIMRYVVRVETRKGHETLDTLYEIG